MKPSVDSHFHIWRQRDLPWLIGPMQPRIFGPYEPLQRDYLIEEYLRDAAPLGIAKSVYVQANWPREQFEDEVAWVQSVADQYGSPHGIVGYADFTADDVRPQIERLQKYPLLRGVRMQLHWHANSQYRFASASDCVNDPVFRRNIARLAEFGLPFDLQLFSGQMADGARLLAETPRTRFILVHAGMLEDSTEQAIEAWRQGIRLLAAQPNAYCKLSGFGTFVHCVDSRLIEFIVRDAVTAFGAHRCMFGSNFPIEKLWSDFSSLIRAYDQATAFLEQSARDQIFSGTATAVYKL